MITIWHNPRCSKSRQTLALLEVNGHAPTVRRYLDDAPSAAELRSAAAALGVSAIEMMRTKEAEFKAEGSSGAELKSGGSTVVKGSMVQIN